MKDEQYKIDVDVDIKTELSNLVGKPASDWIEWLQFNKQYQNHVKMYMKDGYVQYNMSARLRYSIGLV